MNLFYEYYRELGGIIDDMSQFERTFVEIMNTQPMILLSNGRPGHINYNTAISRMFQYYIKKFDL